ncbi:unnamed protein product [Prunus armeniaca]|uniref:Uncharacterized protein n=1 Tax=Prunus armeniaca TaxID=36596 RepID=A0A6J5V7F4_PRUAR|nr:unnamed protein product [Prunus armeniaca]
MGYTFSIVAACRVIDSLSCIPLIKSVKVEVFFSGPRVIKRKSKNNQKIRSNYQKRKSNDSKNLRESMTLQAATMEKIQLDTADKLVRLGGKV